jgi:hypothetical protein
MEEENNSLLFTPYSLTVCSVYSHFDLRGDIELPLSEYRLIPILATHSKFFWKKCLCRFFTFFAIPIIKCATFD